MMCASDALAGTCIIVQHKLRGKLMTIRPGYIAKSGRTCTRMKSSVNGNPRFRVSFADGTSHATAPDAACAYGIENSDLNGDVQIKLNGREQIIDIRPLDA